MTADPQALELLTQIADDVRAIRAAVDARHVRRRLSRGDEMALVALLPVIAAAVGNRTFSVNELFAHAELNVESSIALREQLAVAGNSRRIGRLLIRADGVDIGGYRIVAVGHAREGMLLSIIAISRKTRPGE